MDLEFGAQLARLKVKQDWFLVIEGPQITRILHGMPAANGLLLFLLEASDHSCRISFMRQFKHSQTMLRFCVAYCHNAVGFEEQQVSSACRLALPSTVNIDRLVSAGASSGERCRKK